MSWCPVRAGAGAHPEREALRFEGRAWTYAQADVEVARRAAVLAAHGVVAGDRVALLSPNHPELAFAFFALGRLGATAGFLNARFTAVELGPLVATLRPRLALAADALAERLAGVAVPRLPLSRVGDEAARAAPSPCDAALGNDTPRAVLFTSGTTGVPKGAVLTDGNFRASARASAANLGAHPAPRWLGTLPLFHVGGLAMLTRSALDGGCLLLHERFDADAVNRALDTEGVTHASLVATTLERVLDARRDAPVPPGFCAALIGGGPVPAWLLARARAAGLVALQTYGLTEACSQAATERPAEADGRTAGPALPGLALRVVDGEGRALPPGAEGEVEVRGPTVMAGYLDRPDATGEALREDGWLRTRDLGVLDARGRLTVLSRRTDLVVRGGENVYPAEIEAVLAEHPAVLEAAVAPQEDARWGQVPVAAVVFRPGAGPAPDLEAHCRARLAGYKVPARFARVAELPRNAMGKVDRRALQALLAD